MTVTLCAKPWVSGYRRSIRLGLVGASTLALKTEGIARALLWVLEELGERAEERGANYVLGVHLAVDPFTEAGTEVHAWGDAAKVERFW